MYELSPKRLREIASAFVGKSMRVGRKPNGGYESVRITYNPTDPSCERFAFAVEEECWRRGAHTLLLTHRSWRERLKHKLKPLASLSELSPIAEAIAKRVDVAIFIGEQDDPNWAGGLAEKLKAGAPARQRLRQILDRRGVRWAYFGWPIPGAAKAYGCPLKRFRRIFFRSIESTFSPRLLELCRFYARALRGGSWVRIQADDGTDLSFSIRGRPVLVDDGVISPADLRRKDVGVNIPAGEVFVAPLETTAEGEIHFDHVVIPGFGRVKGLWLRFRRGKVESFNAERGEVNLESFFRANTGEKDRIAEFGVGCNPGASYTGSIIVDEKIFGTVHIAVGNNTGAYHGRNRASSHLDFIKDMHQGEVLVDGKPILRKGKPIACVRRADQEKHLKARQI